MNKSPTSSFVKKGGRKNGKKSVRIVKCKDGSVRKQKLKRRPVGMRKCVKYECTKTSIKCVKKSKKFLEKTKKKSMPQSNSPTSSFLKKKFRPKMRKRLNKMS
jgi:hypothetical protein